MKGKLSVLAMLVCCLAILAACNNNKNKENQSVQVPAAIKKIISQKYPDATILKFEKEQNGSEVEIKDKGFHKEVSFGANGEWIKTQWDLRAEDVPTLIMDGLTSSQYNQYTVEDVDAEENPNGTFYTFELKMNNNEIKLTFDSAGQLYNTIVM